VGFAAKCVYVYTATVRYTHGTRDLALKRAEKTAVRVERGTVFVVAGAETLVRTASSV